MRNKKAAATFFVVLAILMLVIVLPLLLWDVAYQDGTTQDIIQGYDKGIIWYHAYLKNDHTTAYCFDNPTFIDVINQARAEQKEVVVTYKKYVGRGMFCLTTGNYERVIMEKISIVGED